MWCRQCRTLFLRPQSQGRAISVSFSACLHHMPGVSRHFLGPVLWDDLWEVVEEGDLCPHPAQGLRSLGLKEACGREPRPSWKRSHHIHAHRARPMTSHVAGPRPQAFRDRPQQLLELVYFLTSFPLPKIMDPASISHPWQCSQSHSS